MSLRDELRSIYDAQGELTPQVIVAAARPKKSPLHSQFEWDDSIAGEKYRLVQAAELIRSIKVTFVAGGQRRDVREFVHVERPDGNTYVPIDVVADDPFTTAIVLRQAEREWKLMRRRYQGLKGFIDMIRRDLGEVG